MKQFFYISIVFLFFSCKKEEVNSVVKIDPRIYGRWLEKSATFESTQYIRTDRFGEYEKGLVVFDDGSLIERSEGGICVGEYCAMDNYYGTYTFDAAKNILRVKVTNFSGPQEYSINILYLSTDAMKIKRN